MLIFSALPSMEVGVLQLEATLLADHGATGEDGDVGEQLAQARAGQRFVIDDENLQ